MSIIRVVPILTVDDLDASVRAFRDVLGMVEVTNLGWLATVTDSHDMRRQVGLCTRDLTAPCNPDLSVQVDDVGSAHDSAVEAGLEIVYPLTDEEWGARRFFYRDPSGRVINVLEAL